MNPSNGSKVPTLQPTTYTYAEVPVSVGELLGANVRRWVYAIYALGSVVLGAIQVGYSAADVDHPTWLTVATAVWVFIGGSQGLLALLKTPSGK